MRRFVPCVLICAVVAAPSLSSADAPLALVRLPAITSPQNPLVLPAPPAEALPADAIGLQPDSTVESETWYQWLTPSEWTLADPWDASFEIGMDGTNGNTETFTFRGAASVKRKVDWSDLRIEAMYVRGSADRVQTKHDGQLNVKHDWLFGDGPWSLFGKMQLEYDEFKAFDVRLVMNSGFGYRLINHGGTTLKGRAGAGTSREFNGPDNQWVPEAVFGMDFEHQLTKRQKLNLTVDYFPAWDNFTDYRARIDAGWQVLLDEATNMSLKFGILDRYDSTPNGLRPNDLDYSLLLLWKL